jgi:hypothetical protein
MKKIKVKSPSAIRDALLERLKEQGRSKYRFGIDCVIAEICQHHTVDEVLSTTSKKQRVPSVAVAIAMLEAADLELFIQPIKRKPREN